MSENSLDLWNWFLTPIFHGFLRLVRQVPLTIQMKKSKNHIKSSQLVAPDEMFVGYTRKYSMAVWTGYSNRLTPVIGSGFTVASAVYRSMMTYLSEDDHPGDWTMPEAI